MAKVILGATARITAMIEAEVKVPVGNLSAVRNALKGAKASFLGKAREFDLYFDHPSRSFMKTDEALRVRRTSEGESSVTYKGPKFRASTKTRLETNVNVSDPSKMVDVLKSLGFRPVIEVVKDRERWEVDGVNAYLDEVDELGSFLELEAMVPKEESLDEVEEQLFDLIGRLGADPKAAVRRSYLELLLAKRGLI